MGFYNYFLNTKRSRVYSSVLDVLNKNIVRYLSSFLHACPKGNLLEVGIGQGDMQKKLALFDGFRYAGLDLNWNICSSVKVNDSNVNALVPFLPFRNDSFSLIYCSHVLEHLSDYRTALRFLAESRRTLRSGGLLVLLFPDYASWKTDFFEVDYSHCFPVGVRRMHQMAQDSEFQIVGWSDYCGPYIGFGGRVFSFFGKLIPFGLLFWLFPKGFFKFRKSGYVFNKNLIFVLKKP